MGLAFFFYFLQQFPLGFHETDIPVLVFLPLLKGAGKLLEQTQGPNRTAPEPVRMITVEKLGSVLISVACCLTQPIQ